MKLKKVFAAGKAALGKTKELAGKAVAGASLMAISGLASAQSSQQADIIAVISDGKTVGLAVAAAGTIAILAIKYSKLPRAA